MVDELKATGVPTLGAGKNPSGSDAGAMPLTGVGVTVPPWQAFPGTGSPDNSDGTRSDIHTASMAQKSPLSSMPQVGAWRVGVPFTRNSLNSGPGLPNVYTQLCPFPVPQ